MSVYRQDKIQNYRSKSYATDVRLIIEAISAVHLAVFPRRKVRAPVLRCEIISSRAPYKAKNVQKIQRINKEAQKVRRLLHVDCTHSPRFVFT